VQSKFERYLIEQCAPTLAGIKVGSLFHYAAEEDEDINDIVHCWSNRLFEKGVKTYLIRKSFKGGLVYVFRPSALYKLLSDKDIKEFLDSHGFAGCDDPDTYVERMRCRFCNEFCFPHEIGIFLGYPLHDVRGFIKNNGRNFRLCGFWKVYDKEDYAERLFAQYNKCRSIYKTMFEKGSNVLKLTVAA